MIIESSVSEAAPDGAFSATLRAMRYSIALVAFSLLASLSCSKTSEPAGSLEVAARWIDEDPDVLEVDDLYENLPTHTYDFKDPDMVAEWTVKDATFESRPGGMLVRPDERRVAFFRVVDIDTSEIDFLELTVGGLGARELVAYWAGRGEQLDPARRLKGERLDVEKFVFKVGEHPEWKGQIRQLRLVIWSVQPSVVRGLTGIRQRLSQERMADAARKSWRIGLDDDRRPARLVVPEVPFEQSVSLEQGSRFSFSYGIHRQVEPGALLRLRGKGSSPDGSGIGGGWETLFETPFADGEQERWHEQEVDLAVLGTGDATLRFEVSGPGGGRLGLPLVANPTLLQPATTEPPPNIVVILVDTLRADRMSVYGYERDTTPNLKAWADRRRATVFEHAVAPSGWTLPSHLSLFSGFDAHHYMVHNLWTQPPDAPAPFPELLRQRGYATEAITGGAYVSYRFGLDRGFESFRNWSDARRQDEEPVDGIKRSIEALKRLQDRPFFLFFHTYAVHTPYKAWQPWFSRFSDLPDDLRVRFASPEAANGVSRFFAELVDDKGVAKPLPDELAELPSDQYDAGIARLDDLLVPLLKLLSKPEFERNTIVVLTSDHGEMLGEHGVYEHGYLYDHNLLIPLIIATPGERGEAQVATRQVRLVDLAPTLIELSGGTPPGGPGRGVPGPVLGRPGAGVSPCGVGVRASHRPRGCDSRRRPPKARGPRLGMAPVRGQRASLCRGG